eukprot:Phypoly_transcript_06381.p1 GENE.Phypoly_transcript_06381~~Phypoly_transcript_06381.p1  ORF type:complete len:508 (+),score=90.42 Phypoly_transcript_06381:219-1742(+)
MENAEYSDIVNQAVPYMLLMTAVEFVFGLFKKKKYHRLNDSLSSLTAGVMEMIWSMLLPSLFKNGIQLYAYIQVYKRFHIVDIPVDSTVASIICFLGVDMGYYWFHRMAHEINAFWAAHVVHHSSEEYNFTTALRQSVLQVYTSWIFYLPLAIFLPPQLFMYHKEINTVYQFWIHTRLISSLGPLEWILNTPSHHRVHHGRNRRYIDKNYAGVLIIWDRMFGTFEPENKDDAVYYGLVHPLGSFDPVWTQFHHVVHILNSMWYVPGWKNKLFVLIKGPGWSIGKPRLGDPTDIPDIDLSDKSRANRPLPVVLSLYVLVHFFVTVWILFVLLTLHALVPSKIVLLLALFLVFSFSSFGAMFDNKAYAFHMEITRLILFIATEVFFWLHYKDEFVFLWYKDPTGSTLMGMHRPLKVLRAFYIFSSIWLIGRYAIFPFYGAKQVDDAPPSSSSLSTSTSASASSSSSSPSSSSSSSPSPSTATLPPSPPPSASVHSSSHAPVSSEHIKAE